MIEKKFKNCKKIIKLFNTNVLIVYGPLNKKN